MLTPLSGLSRLAYEFFHYRSEFMIAVHSGPRPDLGPADWRFTTIVRGVRAGYYERWIASDEKRKKYYLDRSYLHLYRSGTDELSEREILALHCDPNEPDDTGELKHAIYKRGPHVHVTAFDQPLPHSHFAHNLGELDSILGSMLSLHRAVSTGIVMLRDQVLDVLEAHEAAE